MGSKGESTALSAVLKHQRPLTAYAMSLVGDLDRARDLVQEAFLRLFDHGEVLGTDHVRPWLFKVVRNLAIDAARHRQRMDPMTNAAAIDPGAAEHVEKRQDASTVLSRFDKLPDNQREVLRLRFMNELTYREIAEVTGLSVSNVGYLIHVGIKALRTELGEKFGAELAGSSGGTR